MKLKKQKSLTSATTHLFSIFHLFLIMLIHPDTSVIAGPKSDTKCTREVKILYSRFSGITSDPSEQNMDVLCPFDSDELSLFVWIKVTELTEAPKQLVMAYNNKFKVFIDDNSGTPRLNIQYVPQSPVVVFQQDLASLGRWIFLLFQVKDSDVTLLIRDDVDYLNQTGNTFAGTITPPFTIALLEGDENRVKAGGSEDIADPSFRGKMKMMGYSCRTLTPSQLLNNWMVFLETTQNILKSFYIIDRDQQEYPNYFSFEKQPFLYKGELNTIEASDPQYFIIAGIGLMKVYAGQYFSFSLFPSYKPQELVKAITIHLRFNILTLPTTGWESLVVLHSRYLFKLQINSSGTLRFADGVDTSLFELPALLNLSTGDIQMKFTIGRVNKIGFYLTLDTERTTHSEVALFIPSKNLVLIT